MNMNPMSSVMQIYCQDLSPMNSYDTKLQVRKKVKMVFCLCKQVGDSGLDQVMAMGSSKTPVMTVDWSHTLQCGTSVAAALDGSVSVATLMHQ